MRLVAPLGIVVKAGVWYLVAMQAARVRTFRISRVLDAALTGERFVRPPKFDLETFWATQTDDYERTRFTARARIRATEAGLARLRSSAHVVAEAIDAAAAVAGADGWAELDIPIEDNDETDALLLSPDILVLSPVALRSRLQRLGSRIGQLYEDDYRPRSRSSRSAAFTA